MRTRTNRRVSTFHVISKIDWILEPTWRHEVERYNIGARVFVDGKVVGQFHKSFANKITFTGRA